ncbi:MAG TPA: folate-binding protein [Alphaproteobacteria bacterium]|nr:folate-binding protein [Alphaproteobacteria bacterium]HNS44298.1 folate-binding protein [Alphaproteobacteria bacterium]
MIEPEKFVKRPHRGEIRIEGPDAFSFLQNIVSNDLNLLEISPFIHACLLTPQGKFLHDFYVSRTAEGYTLECEGGERTRDLAKRLTLYKLRANISIEANEDITIYITASSRSPSPPNGTEIPLNEWDTERILRGEPDGSRDAEVGVSTLAELNLDEKAVSYTKGCYVGQELVARMHNRNLGKKHLVSTRFKKNPPQSGTEIENYGLMRSKCGNLGLILMNRETEAKTKETQNDDSEIYLLGL